MDIDENESEPLPSAPGAEYEACAPGALPSEQMAFVRAIQEKVLRGFAEELGSRLEAPVAAHIADVQPIPGSEFFQSCDQLGCLLTLEAEPVRGQAFLAFSAGLIAYLLRVFLGAPATPEEGSRAVTEIELHILGETFELLVAQLTEGWKPAGVSFRWLPGGAIESGSAQGTLLVFDCRLEVDSAQYSLRIAAPAFLARLAALDATPAGEEEAPGPVRETILGALRRASVDVEAVLSGSTLLMKDLLAMEPGHVLMLGQSAGSPLECRINGKAKFQGEWVSRGDRHGIELL
jgi:flagellar motor switch protein FliM